MADRIDGEGAGAPLSDARTTTPDNPSAVRAEIEQTRERMSETIDEIEGVLARKREQIQERLDIMSPVRKRPLPSAGIAFGAGLVLGLLTGGDDDDEEDDGYEARSGSRGYLRSVSTLDTDSDDWETRAHMWEARARRLLRVAREQEDEIRDLQERYGTLYTHELELAGLDAEVGGALHEGVTGWRDHVLGGITNFLGQTFQGMGQASHGRS